MKLYIGHMRTWKPLLLVVVLIGVLGFGVSGCDDDMPTEPTPPPEETPDPPEDSLDPNVFCDNGLCAESDALKNECVEEFNVCTGSGGVESDCAAASLLTCGIQNGLDGI